MAIGRINASLSGVQPGGLAKVVPTSIAVGSGSGSSDANGNVTFSSASSVSLNGCFSSAYQNYKVVLNISASGSSDLQMRFRASGSDATTNYNRYGIAVNSSGSTVNYGSGTTQAFFYVVQTSGIDTGAEFNLYSPFETIATRIVATSSGGTSPVFMGGRHTTASSYDGFTLYPDSTTITGTVRVYGYN
jgi:hypothetical protein